MSTELAQTGTTDLTITGDQGFWTDKQIAALRQLGMDNARNGDLAVFFHQCARTGLDPFAKQIYMIERQGKQTIQTGIDGFRLVARRATDRGRGTLGYEDTLWCGEDGQWVEVWLRSEAPAAAKVVVTRDGQRYPAVATYSEYAGLKRDGNPNQMWSNKPALMLAKCAEALALRKAFPQDLSGLYTADELPQDERATSEPRRDTPPALTTSGEGSARPAASKISTSTDSKIAESEDVAWLEKCREWLQGYKASEPERVAELEALVDARIHNLTAEPEPEPIEDEQPTLDAELVEP